MSRFGEHISLASKPQQFHILHMSDTVMRGSSGVGEGVTEGPDLPLKNHKI